MKLFKIGISFLAISLFLNSCRGPKDPKPLTIVGVWKIISVDTSISEISAGSRSSSKNISADDLFIQFYSNLTFATNSDLSLTKLQVAPSDTRIGSYTYVVDNNQDRLVLSFFDNVLLANVALSFEIRDMKTNNPVLNMNTQDYLQSLKESAAEMEPSLGQALISFSNRINSANFTLNCKK